MQTSISFNRSNARVAVAGEEYHCYSSQDGFVCSWFLDSAPPNISWIPRLLRIVSLILQSPFMMNPVPGYRTSPRVTACLQFMESALTAQWDFHFPASEQETISANLGIYGYIMAKYLRNMALKCYLGGLFPTFLAFSVNRCVIFPSSCHTWVRAGPG